LRALRVIARYDERERRARKAGVCCAAVARKPDLYVPLIVLLRPIPRIVYREIHFAFTRPLRAMLAADISDLIRARARASRSDTSKIAHLPSMELLIKCLVAPRDGSFFTLALV